MPFADYRVALVTGASSGIGASVVERLAREGLTVHAIARRADRLEELRARTGCIVHAVDITDTAQLQKVAASLPVDILVNNAGVNRAGSITTAKAEDLDDIVDRARGPVARRRAVLLERLVRRPDGVDPPERRRQPDHDEPEAGLRPAEPLRLAGTSNRQPVDRESRGGNQIADVPHPRRKGRCVVRLRLAAATRHRIERPVFLVSEP